MACRVSGGGGAVGEGVECRMSRLAWYVDAGCQCYLQPVSYSLSQRHVRVLPNDAANMAKSDANGCVAGRRAKKGNFRCGVNKTKTE